MDHFAGDSFVERGRHYSSYAKLEAGARQNRLGDPGQREKTDHFSGIVHNVHEIDALQENIVVGQTDQFGVVAGALSGDNEGHLHLWVFHVVGGEVGVLFEGKQLGELGGGGCVITKTDNFWRHI